MPAWPAPRSTAARPDPAAACAPARLVDWEALTRAACQAQAAQQLEQALAGHVRALWAVEALLDDPLLRTHPDPCLAALVVSHHNLSDLYRLRGQLLPAVEHCCTPHELLLHLAAGAPPAVQEAAWRHLCQTRAALLEWQRAHGPHPRIDECVRLWPQSCAPASAALRH